MPAPNGNRGYIHGLQPPGCESLPDKEMFLVDSGRASFLPEMVSFGSLRHAGDVIKYQTDEGGGGTSRRR